MIRAVVVMASAALLLVQPFANAAERETVAPAIPVAVTSRIDRHFTERMAKEHIPGGIWVIVKDGRIAYFGQST